MKKFIKILLIVLGAILLAAVVFAAAIAIRVKLNVPVFLSMVKNDASSALAVSGTVYRDVVYKTADGQALKLDIYEPTRQLFRQSPTIFVYHGGGWVSGSKALNADDSFIKSALSYGIAVVSVDYRLASPKTVYPAPLDDAADAIRFIGAHADEYRLDSSRFCAFGTSAGGQMALMLALEGKSYGSSETCGTPCSVRCAVSLCGPTDFTSFDGYAPESKAGVVALLTRFFGGTIDEKRALYQEASPILHVAKGAPPILLIHGTKDETVPFAQAQRFSDAAAQAGMSVTFVPVQNADHKFQAIGGAISPTKEELVRQIVQFLLKNLVY